jgi:hypothetical protein
MMRVPTLAPNREYQDPSGMKTVNHAVGESMHEEPTNSGAHFGAHVWILCKPLQRRLHFGR